MEEKREFQEIRVGEKIKTIREGKGLSLKEVADLTGFSTALLSQMENHLVSPSLGTMIKLANALGVRVGDLLGETQGEPFAIVRKDERKSVSRFASKDGVKYGYSYESLGFEKKDRHMEPFIVTLEPATVKTSKTSVHEGEEFIFVLEGEMEVILGDHTDVLSPGDSIYYDSTIPHRVQCHQDKVTRILAVLYAPGT
ncbi:MAG: cupin domain-containing protein [Thermodesulfobacteriota bacterium]|nr:cupin domain-containing protein [Thermodesulfobacteriota bacterium]